MLIRSAYSDRFRQSISFLDEDGNPSIGRTKQCHKEECEIGNILRMYDKTGLIIHVNKLTAEYGDYTQINEYKVNLEMVIKARDSFETLPSHVRKKFGNDPGNFIEFASNPENHAEMVKLGLAKAPIVTAPAKAPEAEKTTSEKTTTEESTVTT